MILPTLRFNVERWKFNSEFRVYVSNLGNIKDEHKKIIPFRVNRGGYLSVKTSYGIKQVHRLVMMTWRQIPNQEDLTVDHKNHNKRDNSLENLEWVTLDENRRRAQLDLLKEPQGATRVTAEYSCFQSAAHSVAHKIYGKKYTPSQLKSVEKQMRDAMTSNKKYGGAYWKQEKM